MKQISISLHSFVDIITNSSTEIYTNPTDKAVESMYDILNTFLKIAGVEKDARELFDVHYATNCKNPEDVEDYDVYDEVPERHPTEEQAQKIKEHLDYECNMDAIRLVVTDKEGKYGDMMKNIWNLFYQEASYNG